MEYKNYLAAVEIDESAGLLHGRVVNSGPYPIATFEAANVAGLRKEFELSVDEYLLSCEEDGVEPRRPFSGKLNVRLGPTLHQQIAEAASTDGVSLNSWIVRAVEERASG
jgi:predicted HicB family RNase H-like nuclease